VLLLLWCLFLLAGFTLAASVEPDPRGFGTHQKLWSGLRPCTFIQLFHIPCPSCGMTTCFAHFVRGQWFAAARANPAGLLLAIVCVMQIAWCGASAWMGRYWLLDDPEMTLVWVMLFLAGAALLQWGVRLALGGYF
jgi:hypothetical protein